MISCAHILLFQNVISYIYNDNGHYIGVWINGNSWDHITWYEAQAYCQTSFSTDLASVHNTSENLVAFNSVEYFINNSNGALDPEHDFFAWIGLVKEESSFVWSDGTHYNYTNWAPGEPSGGSEMYPEECVHFRSRDDAFGKALWNDLDCTHDYNIQCFVCNKPNLNPNATTMIPTTFPAMIPTAFPAILPSNSPSDVPSQYPSISPSSVPSNWPSNFPSDSPSTLPSNTPSNTPSDSPSDTPWATPSISPSNAPSDNPTSTPSSSPTDSPSSQPTSNCMCLICTIICFIPFCDRPNIAPCIMLELTADCVVCIF